MQRTGTSTADLHRDYAAKSEVQMYLAHPSANPHLYDGAEIRLFDILFANLTFMPTDEQVLTQYKMDRNLNQHNEHYYPYLRTKAQIIADFRIQFALCLLAKRNEAMGHQTPIDLKRWIHG